jgi:hypothetical protein
VIKFDEAVDNPALVFRSWLGIPQAKWVNAAGQSSCVLLATAKRAPLPGYRGLCE